MMKNFSCLGQIILALSLALMGASGQAAVTSISNIPLASGTETSVKPNVMFILDDSGSMSWSYLGDDVFSTTKNYVNKVGYRNAICNKAYYNPAVTYALPVDAEGNPYPAPEFSKAFYDGFKTNSVTVDLSARFMAWRSNNSSPRQPSGYSEDCWSGNGALGSCRPASSNRSSDFIKNNKETAAYYFIYKGNRAANLGDNSGNDHCKNDDADYTTNWTKVTVSSASGPGGTDERQNFANWYSYYRTRMLAMKTSVGLAFKGINDNYRVGYTTHSYAAQNLNGANNSEFQQINDFAYTTDNTGQKNKWYSKLYGAVPDGGTPLRAALSWVGRMYAGKILTGRSDPVQYSCQQNFTILATDGYWNDSDGSAVQKNGSTRVGNQDGGDTPRPMFDNQASNTLADVAMYYYQTDLRDDGTEGAIDGIEVGKNNVLGSGDDIQKQQHMTTFTLGLGLNGTLQYKEDYLTSNTGDYYDIKNGNKNWPVPVGDQPTTIDDLWHAAVNGRGTYFSAKDPTTLVSGLTKALAGIDVRNGAGAAGAASNLAPVAGDNLQFTASYRTGAWDGDLQARTIDPETLALSSTPIWKAQSKLDNKVSAASDTREIYVFDSTAVGKLKPFIWGEDGDGLSDAEKLSGTEKAYFKNVCVNNALSQCPDLATTEKDTVNAGETLVGFLRGQSGNEDREGTNAANRLYRNREHVLGDIVGSQPAYVKQPPFSYADDNYSLYKTQKASRSGMVYVGANDGMLHAFDSTTGIEKWAYIPPMVMPNLYKLADKNYASRHQFFVDGSPVIGDICPKASGTCEADEWKTILVGGLNAGGKGYYALDITNPLSPKAMWNFTITSDDGEDLGLSFGNPIITKRHDGTWIVALTSGYNNIEGDGKGHLYLLKASTGDVQLKLTTTAGSKSTPSGLAKIAGWIDSASDNTAERYYGGDLLGNVWRFDTEDVVLPEGREAFLLAELGNVDPVGVQPITTKPLLAEIISGNASHAVITVGTGRYLGDADRSNVDQQSIYALKDDLGNLGLGKVRSSSDMVEQTLITTDTGRTTSSNTVNWNTKSGWYLDLNPGNTSRGERINIDMVQLNDSLIFAGNVPDNNACSAGGSFWLYVLDYRSGQYVQNSTNNNAGQYHTDSMAAGINIMQKDNGDGSAIIVRTDGSMEDKDIPRPPRVPAARRVSWQELIVD